MKVGQAKERPGGGAKTGTGSTGKPTSGGGQKLTTTNQGSGPKNGDGCSC